MESSEIQIDALALKSNFRQLQELSGSRPMFPVIKANAYGHGLSLIAKFLEDEFDEKLLPYFCVARALEAENLRKAGIKRPLLVMSEYSSAEVSQLCSQNVEFVVSTFEDFERILSVESKSGSIHLNINTGMNRLGFDFRRLEQNLDRLCLKVMALAAKGWTLTGLMTHLARGEEDPTVFSYTQVERFQEAVARLKKEFKERGLAWPAWIHVSNSGALLRGVSKDPLINASRPGLHLWGAHSDGKDREKFQLKPVLKCSASIRQIRQVPAGESVGYGQAFVCSKDRVLATVNMGYADGIPRILSRKENDSWKIGMVVGGVRVPFVGIISMDLSIIDLTSHPWIALKGPEAFENEQAFWICDEQNAEEIAEILGTIPYEVFCNLSARLRRKLVSHS